MRSISRIFHHKRLRCIWAPYSNKNYINSRYIYIYIYCVLITIISFKIHCECYKLLHAWAVGPHTNRHMDLVKSTSQIIIIDYHEVRQQIIIIIKCYTFLFHIDVFFFFFCLSLGKGLVLFSVICHRQTVAEFRPMHRLRQPVRLFISVL